MQASILTFFILFLSSCPQHEQRCTTGLWEPIYQSCASRKVGLIFVGCNSYRFSSTLKNIFEKQREILKEIQILVRKLPFSVLSALLRQYMPLIAKLISTARWSSTYHSFKRYRALRPFNAADRSCRSWRASSTRGRRGNLRYVSKTFSLLQFGSPEAPVRRYFAIGFWLVAWCRRAWISIFKAKTVWARCYSWECKLYTAIAKI